MLDELMTARQVADLLQMRLSTVETYAGRGLLPSVQGRSPPPLCGGCLRARRVSTSFATLAKRAHRRSLLRSVGPRPARGTLTKPLLPYRLGRWNSRTPMQPPQEPFASLTVGQALSRLRASTALAVLGSVMVIVGSLGPWLSTVLGSVSGVQGSADGRLTLGAGVVAMLALAAGRGRQWGSLLAGMALLAALGVACFDTARVVYETSKLTVFGYRVAGAGWGLYLTVAGAAIGVVALTAAALIRERDGHGVLIGTRRLSVRGRRRRRNCCRRQHPRRRLLWAFATAGQTQAAQREAPHPRPPPR